jgi:heme exporter protein C
MRSLGGGLLAATLLAAAGFLVVPLLILSAPLEPVMGVVQKIFYFHVPCAIMMFVATFVCAAGSVAFLFKGSERGDRLALAAGELGVLFGVCVLVSGPLWGRKAWGVYWQWDARLTTSFLLFLILISYLLARKYGGPGGRRLAAALALFAAVDVPLVYKSVDLWRTIHPQTTVVRTLDPGMRPAFWASFALITLVFGILLTLRMRLEAARASLAELRLAAEDLLEAQRP